MKIWRRIMKLPRAIVQEDVRLPDNATQSDSQSYNILLVTEDEKLKATVEYHLCAAGYPPRSVLMEDVFAMEPSFGPNGEAVFIVDAAPDKERMHELARHLYSEWSEKGWVGFQVFHRDSSTDEDVQKLWALDALWRYQSPQHFVVQNYFFQDACEEFAREIVRSMPEFTDEEVGESP